MRPRPVKVSIVMPAYNAARTIDKAIRSVLAQKGVSFELLIGNDGSTDETASRLEAYRSNPRIRIFHFKRNRGTSYTSNRLIARAKGKYIATCDSDDRMLPGNLYALAAILERDPSAGAAYGDLLVRQPNGKAWIKRKASPSAWDLMGGCFANGGSLIRRSLLKKVGGYKEHLSYLEDCDLFLRLSEITSFRYLPGKPLYIQHKTPGSLSDQPRKKQKAVSRMLLRKAIQRRYGIKVKW